MSKSTLSYGSFDVNYILVPQLWPKLQGKVSEMILLLCMQPWFSIDKCDSKPIKRGWKCQILVNFSVGLNVLDYKFRKLTFRSLLLVWNHIRQSRIKVACKVAKSSLTLFSVTLVKVEVQESNLHEMSHKKVYFLTCFMQNIQKPNMVGSRALNDRANHYGPPCKCCKAGINDS